MYPGGSHCILGSVLGCSDRGSIHSRTERPWGGAGVRSLKPTTPVI